MKGCSFNSPRLGSLWILCLLSARCIGADGTSSPDSDSSGRSGSASAGDNGSTAQKGNGAGKAGGAAGRPSQSDSGAGGAAGATTRGNSNPDEAGGGGANDNAGGGNREGAGATAQSAGDDATDTGRGGAAGAGGVGRGGSGGRARGTGGMGGGGRGGAGGAAGGSGGRDNRGGGGAGGAAGAAGSAGGAEGSGDDGCSDVVASDLTVQQVAAYQSVKVPLMVGGAEVVPPVNSAEVVQGRDTMFRVFVTPGASWSAHEVSARLSLTSGEGDTKQYYAKKSVSKASADADLSTTFQINVPASAMAASLRYSVRVVECGGSSKEGGQAQFPTSGDSDVGVKTTGGLKIKIIPIQVNDLLPDTSQTVLDAYAKMMMAMYPISSISITVGDTLPTTSPLNWTTMVDQVRSKRTKDAPASDVYYFGLVKPAQTLTAYCKSVCTLGIGLVVPKATQAYGRAAVGVGFADDHSYLTMAHEIGHNHGRDHAPCVPNGGSISGVDKSYPDTKGFLDTWGWDPRTSALVSPTKGTDIMGYCNSQWISGYTYDALATRVAEVNGATMLYTSAAAVGKWRVLLVEGQKAPRWGVPIEEDSAAEGAPEQAKVYDGKGDVLKTVTVYRMNFSDVDGSLIMVPEPGPDWYAIGVEGTTPHPFAAPVEVPRP